MLAELAAFNAAFATVKATVKAGSDLQAAFKSIGQMIENKDVLQEKLSKKRNSLFSPAVDSELDEFMALESIKQAEEELKQIMIYQGRPGLYDDWVMFQAKARKARQEAKKEAARKRRKLMTTIVTSAAIGIPIALTAIFFATIYYIKKGF